MSPCLSGILSQNFQGPVGNDRASFLCTIPPAVAPCDWRFPGTFLPLAGLQYWRALPRSAGQQNL